jgi:hypothetical protein
MAKHSHTLGLDWDGTISHFPESCALLASKFRRCVVITLNHTITPTMAKQLLGVEDVQVEVCPFSSQDFPAWKVKMCHKHRVALMVDDDPDVIRQCEDAGIRGFLVGVAEWKD